MVCIVGTISRDGESMAWSGEAEEKNLRVELPSFEAMLASGSVKLS
jgi:hypothetical protein